ncbi:TonB-dependent siderophore receptor [Terriglobus roseus DSM 18391]|uniref:TonB-dependent siderophore receptor n=1 Tax=Terriglobus roseus (strain DSM 18391 / NRRL B-41598 / KBS 63) TaxID=926566 RepID=I3ZDW7_TERRK|nr:TonB-dependent siderophore receptor [Terriglobus roseus]AFL87435.1 TonB-dependent siderophore receptor [Terriglobus roseus DSM 18391]
MKKWIVESVRAAARTHEVCLPFIAVAAVSAGTLMAQGPSACSAVPANARRALHGVVTDTMGAAVPKAQVTLRCGSLAETVVTDAAGSYTASVPAGSYALTVESPNFETISRTVDVQDQAAGTVTNLRLPVAGDRNSVTVTAGNMYATPISSGGSKLDMPLNELPQSVTVVNRELMNSQGVVKLDDALKNVAGVMPGGYYDNYDFYRIRGFDGSYNTFIDGLRSGNGLGEETWGVESVEVIKGPSSALYGQAPLGGLINLVTRKPIPDRFAHIQMTGGTFNFLDPAVDLGGSLTPNRKLYGRVAAIYHSADTFVDYTYRHRYYVAPSLTWKPRNGTQLTLLGRVQRDNLRVAMPLPAVGTVLPNPNGPIPVNVFTGELDANSNKMSQANQGFGVQFQHVMSENFTLRENARVTWYQQDWNRLYYPSYLGADNRTLYRYPLSWHENFGAQQSDTSIQGKGTLFGMEHNVLLGVDFFRKPSDAKGYSIDFADPTQYEGLDLYKPVYGQSPVRPLQLYTASNTALQYTGVYLQDHIRLPHDITITGGARNDWAKNVSKGSPNQNALGLSPRLGVTWQAIQPVTLYASFGKSFMPQSGFVFDGSLSGRFVSPERGQQWEGGAKTSFLNGKLLGNVALFQLERRNVATSDPAHPNFYLVTGTQRSRGVELEATVHPIAGFNLSSSYAFVNAMVTNDNTLPAGTPTVNAPRHLFNLWGTYEVPRGRARGLLIGFGGRRYTSQSGDLAHSFDIPGYGLMDASAGYTHGHAQWRVNAYNLANTRYFRGSYSNVYVNPGEPRTVRATMSWNF